MNNINYPLVTIGVVTYNSGDFILETLDSIKSQTYPNIELIVSDDCSADDTVEKCQKWFEDNATYFVRAELVTSPINTGVSGNSNRAFSKATGKWYKLMDGDDILMPNAIADYIEYINKYPERHLVVAPAIHFVEKFDINNIGAPDEWSDYLYREEMTAKKQSKIISKMFFGSGPTCFVKTDDIRAIGGFDERFPLCEDYPLLVNLIYYGDKMWMMDKPTVYKRIRSTSIQYSREKNTFYGTAALQGYLNHKYLFKYERHNLLWKLLHRVSLWLNLRVIKSGNNSLIRKCRIYRSIQQTLDPYIIYSKLIHLRIRRYELKKKNNG